MNHKSNEKRPFTLSVIGLICANLLPLFGALFLKWDIQVIMLIYWMENLVVGFYNAIKMAWCNRGTEPSGIGGKIFIICFFSFHFGMFCMVHGVFVLVMTNFDADIPFSPEQYDFLPGPLMILSLPISLLSTIWEAHGLAVAVPTLGMLISHGVSFFENFLGKREYEERDVSAQMFMPYGRIVVMHIAILAAGVPVMLFGSPIVLLAILVVMKIGFDYYLHVKSHQMTDK